jgi:hypothetical protein
MDHDPSGTIPDADAAQTTKSGSDVKAGEDGDDRLDPRAAARAALSNTSDLLARTEATKEVSAATIGRMLGLATSTDLKLLEGKLELIQSKVTNLTVRLEKALSILQSAPTGSDLERIDVQIGGLKSLILEVLAKNQAAVLDSAEKSARSEGPKPRARILSSSRGDAADTEGESN